MASQPFPVEHSNLDLRQPSYVANRENWALVLERFEKSLKDVSAEGTESSLSRHQVRGQLLGIAAYNQHSDNKLSAGY